MKKRNALLVAALAGSFIAANASAVSVNLELSLLVDVSGSVDAAEFNLQRGGYVNAFQNLLGNAAGFNSIIGAGNSIAVNFIEWSSGTEQQEVVGWTLIDSPLAAFNFGTLIGAAPRAFNGNTAPGSAIAFAAPLFNNNGFEGARNVIDVSGDGAQNTGANTAAARDAALAGGIDQINGLPILGEAGLLAWYQNNIQGGVDSFTIPSATFGDFADAIERKLRIEIGAPLPAAAGTGLATMGLVTFMRRRRQDALPTQGSSRNRAGRLDRAARFFLIRKAVATDSVATCPFTRSGRAVWGSDCHLACSSVPRDVADDHREILPGHCF
jgi:hypothetical protein